MPTRRRGAACTSAPTSRAHGSRGPPMNMAERVDAVAADPAGLEALYRSTLAAGDAEPFAVEIARRHATAPADLLMTVWYHRLRPGSVTVAPPTEQRAA